MEVTALLEAYGISAGEAFPGAELPRLREPKALVCVHRADQGTGGAELSIRILSPRGLGLWKCQDTALQAMNALASVGMSCRMEPMEFEEGCDCFSAEILAIVHGALAGSFLSVKVGLNELSYVTEFTAEQDRGRRLIGGVNQETPVGITSGTGGWRFCLKRTAPTLRGMSREPEEPFDLTVTERGAVTRYTGCCLNRVKKTVTREETTAQWEGFALEREEL